jgi:transcriptional regulator with XRE-family HTH domain
VRRGTSPRLGVRLELARVQRGLSVRGAARAAGIDPGYYFRLEHCQRRPSPKTAGALARVLGLDEADRALLAIEAGTIELD